MTDSMGRPICGHPVRFYSLGRPRTDLFPVCHRPPGHAEREQASGRMIRHLSGAAVDAERARIRASRRRYDRAGRRRDAILSEPGDRDKA